MKEPTVGDYAAAEQEIAAYTEDVHAMVQRVREHLDTLGRAGAICLAGYQLAHELEDVPDDGMPDAPSAGFRRAGATIAVALMLLSDEESAHGKTVSNFEEFCAKAADITTANYDEAELRALRHNRFVDMHFEETAKLAAERERFRIAWTSARQRATNRTDALVDADQERDALRALVRNVQWYGTGYLYRDSSGVDHLLSPADVTVFVSTDHETEVERLTRERDEARAEVVRLGLKSEKLIEENEQLRRDRAWEASRANEAARLSADARDDAEARDTVIADLREQVAIVEGDRTATWAWAVNVVTEYGIEHQLGEEFPAIARYIRDLKEDIATYRHVTDSSINAREFYARKVERVALLRTWTTEDGKSFLFADEVRAALDGD